MQLIRLFCKYFLTCKISSTF